MSRKIMTVSYVLNQDEILLGYKKPKPNKNIWVGENYWNGFGGNVEPGETIAAGAKRELEEESGLISRVQEKCGIILITYESKPIEIELHFFLVTKFAGILKNETKEMFPKWHKIKNISQLQMWGNDKYSLPQFLAGKKCTGQFHLNNQKEIISYILNMVETLPESINRRF